MVFRKNTGICGSFKDPNDLLLSEWLKAIIRGFQAKADREDFSLSDRKGKSIGTPESLPELAGQLRLGPPFATLATEDNRRSMKSSLPLVLSLMVLLSSCSDSRSPEKFFGELLVRIANVTEVVVNPKDAVVVLPSYPRPRDLVLAVEDIRVGFGTYLALGRCGLVGEVSARNSSLGKFQSASARLLYETRFLNQLKGCIDDLQPVNQGEHKNFLAEVQSIAERKTAILPAVFWNATFGAPEFRVLLSTQTDPLPMRSEPSATGLVTALDFISEQAPASQANLEPIAESALESQYYVLQSSKLIGQLLQGMVVTMAYMERGSELLETVAEQKKLCPMGRKTVKGEYLFNVFRKFYIGEAQPYISLIHTQTRPLVEVIGQLVETQGIDIPIAFQNFYDQTLNQNSKDSAWVKFNLAIARHTKAWQSVLNQCDLMPQP